MPSEVTVRAVIVGVSCRAGEGAQDRAESDGRSAEARSQGRPPQPPGDVEASSSALPGWSSVCAGVSGCLRMSRSCGGQSFGSGSRRFVLPSMIGLLCSETSRRHAKSYAAGTTNQRQPDEGRERDVHLHINEARFSGLWLIRPARSDLAFDGLERCPDEESRSGDSDANGRVVPGLCSALVACSTAATRRPNRDPDGRRDRVGTLIDRVSPHRRLEVQSSVRSKAFGRPDQSRSPTSRPRWSRRASPLATSHSRDSR